jgi:hypothetical protein
MKVLVSGYQSIDMHCIALHVKFDGGLSISFQRKATLYKKKGGSKAYIFKKFLFSKSFETPLFEKSYIFLASHFSPKLDSQPVFKFYINLDVFLIYRLIPRKLCLRVSIVFYTPLQLVAFWGLLSAFTTAHNVKVVVSRHHSTDMYCVVPPVKFESGSSISVL